MQGRREEHDLSSPTARGLRSHGSLTVDCGSRSPSGGRGVGRRFFSRPSRGRAVTRHLGHVVVVLLFAQFALAISAAACEGPPTLPLVPEPPVGGDLVLTPVRPDWERNNAAKSSIALRGMRLRCRRILRSAVVVLVCG